MQLKQTGKSSLYGAGQTHTARVVEKGGVHTVKFFRKGVYMSDADYTATDKDDAHTFAHDEMEWRKRTSTDKSTETVAERINEPQGHLETADHITADSKSNGVAPKKQMGNRTPLEIIAKILAGKK